MQNNQYSKYTQTDYTGKNMPSSRITSRRAKVIENKLFTQIIFFGVLTVVLLVGFVVVIIPNVIKLLAGSSSNQVISQDDLLPPLTPTISTPVEATNSAQLSLRGFAEKGSQVVVLINGQEVKKIDVSEDGSFSSDIALQSGENAITAYSIKPNTELESNVTPAYLVKFDNEAPKLEITDPQDNQSVIGSKNAQLTVNGMTDPNTKIVLNDRLVFVKSDGSFTTSFQLNSGENTLSFKATDEAGNMTEKKVTVRFSL